MLICCIWAFKLSFFVEKSVKTTSCGFMGFYVLKYLLALNVCNQQTLQEVTDVSHDIVWHINPL